MKNAVVVYYSQTGQLKQILYNFIKPWREKYNIDFIEITCEEYTFPLSWHHFFDTFPESVLKIPCEITYQIKKKDYDLVILGFQPWFVHTSIPFYSFMIANDTAELINNREVVLVMDSRNSWRNCLKEVEEQVQKYNGSIRGKYVFRDTAKNIPSLISLFIWLFTGKKKQFNKKLPMPGIDPHIMNKASTYGRLALNSLDDSKTKYVLVPHVGEEFTSIGYERYAIDKYKKWAVFVRSNNKLLRRLKLILFELWVLFTIIFLSASIAKKSKTN